ncbi:hypothetical protein GIX45_29315 [Erwinia sp. CPCC 100877]|nr:hypothetical protein [Erwinia sp. CPCC 100877]
MMNINVISNDTYYLIGSEQITGFREINISPYHVNNLNDLSRTIENCQRTGNSEDKFIFILNGLTLVEHAINCTRQKKLTSAFLVDQPLEYNYFVCNGLLFASKKHSRHGFYDILSRLNRVQDLSQGIISDREMEVLGMLLNGVDTKEIAQRLAISSKTVSAHKKKVARRFGMDNWNDALMFKYLTMIIECDESAAESRQAAQSVPVQIPYWHNEKESLPNVEALPVVSRGLAAIKNIARFRL